MARTYPDVIGTAIMGNEDNPYGYDTSDLLEQMERETEDIEATNAVKKAALDAEIAEMLEASRRRQDAFANEIAANREWADSQIPEDE